MMSFLRKLYDDGYHHLSKKKVEEYKISIEESYRLLAKKYDSRYFDLAKFQGRYLEAIKNKSDMHEFFKVEMEGIDQFLEKVKKVAQKKKEFFSKEPQEDSSVDDKAKANFEAEEEEEDDSNSVFDRIYQQYEKQIKKYPKVFIHRDASEEIERLLGCLLEFRKKVFPVLALVEGKFKKDRSTEKYFQETNLLFDDLAKPEKVNQADANRINQLPLPFIFSNYRFKVEKADQDDHLIELADINVLKNTVELIRKIKKIVSWFDLSIPTQYQNVKVKYGDEELNLETLKNILVSDGNKILRDFRLEDF